MAVTPVTVAVVQDAPVAFDTAATMDRLRSRLDEAAAAGASLVVFPEAYLGAYPKGADFGARVGLREPQGRRWFRRYFEGAVTLDGPEIAAVARWCRERALNVVLGLIERDGGTLYCTVAYLGADGRLFGHHRKVMPTAMERLLWGFGDGSTLAGAVFDGVGTVTSAICWENYLPLLRTSLYDQQPDFYCAPTVDDREVWQATMRHIAVEGRVHVLAACQFARRADYPADYECLQGNDPETVLIGGGSMIVDPFGEIVAGPLRGRTGLLIAELDPGRAAEGKFDLDVMGHYARPDLFELRVHTAPQRPVRPQPPE